MNFGKPSTRVTAAPFGKKFEWARGKSSDAQHAWKQLGGPGVIAKKKPALLHFLKTGESQDGGLKESQEASNSKTTNELFEWVPWKQVLDWYGEEEALDRVENGSLPVRKEQKKWYEFLLF